MRSFNLKPIFTHMSNANDQDPVIRLNQINDDMNTIWANPDGRRYFKAFMVELWMVGQRYKLPKQTSPIGLGAGFTMFTSAINI